MGGAAGEEQAIEVVRRSIETLNERDLDGVMACFTDDVTFDGSRIMEGIYRGKQAYREFLEEAIERVSPEHSEVSFLTSEDRVIALADVRGTGDRSGLPLAGRIAYVYEMREGLIARQEIHPDGEALLASIGLSE